MKRLLFVLIVLFALQLLWAQYDEKQILSQKANQHLVQRQYSEAELVFKEILHKYPNDMNSIIQLMQIYLSLNQGEKAEGLLAEYQRIMPQNTAMEYQIQVLLMQGKLSEAESQSEAYLRLYPSDINKYRLIASYYERRNFYDKAISYYQRGRALSTPNTFNLEIANAAMQLQRWDLALLEYLEYSKTLTNINQYIKNQIKGIVLADSLQIGQIESFIGQYSTPILLETYAFCLITLKDYHKALEIYKSLPENYMRDFAYEQQRQKHFEVALPAFKHLALTNAQPFQRIAYHVEVAKIHYSLAEYDSAAVALNTLLADSYWKQSPSNIRNPIYVSIRKMLAEIAMAKGDDIQHVQELLEEAKSYSNQSQMRQELDLEHARLSLLGKDFRAAESKLATVNLQPVMPVRDYLYYLSAFLQCQAEVADSLMHEYLIRYPENDFANDIIYLNMLAINLDEAGKRSFSEGIALLQQLKPAGIDSLLVAFEGNKDEELLLLAIEWAIGLNQPERARTLLEYEFTDPLSQEYAAWLRLALIGDSTQEVQLAKSFLKQKPNSIFSPSFRQVISRVAASRLSL
ncbi:MAG: tetratricopeptide repeat protein [Candidatus Cloacimonetes bacterium]|nr:tetratricopeptide repeat protein [Candidatus Cloacimonadota bacterium]